MDHMSISDRNYLKTIKDIRAKRMQKEEVELDEAFKLKTKVRIHAPGKSYHNTEGTIGEVRPGLYKGAPKMFTVYHGERGAIQLPKENLRIVKEEVDLTEVLKASDPVGKWIDDFVNSDNSKFDGKSKEERRKMALGAYYAAQKNEEVELDESKSEDAHFAKQSKKMQDAINLHLRKGKTYSDAVKAAKVHVKEEVEQVDEKMNDLQKKAVKSALDYRSKIGMKSSTSDAKKIIKFVKNEEVEQIEEGPFSSGALKPSQAMLDAINKIPSKSTVISKDEKGSYTQHSTRDANGKVTHSPKIYHNKEEVEQELDEGRGRPPKEGSKAWHAAQAKAQSGESSDQEADKNIVNQMRKKPVGDTHHLVFGNGEKKEVHVKHVNKALSMLANTPKPADREKLQASLGHSHNRFMDTVTSGKPVEDKARPKVSLGSMKREHVEIDETVDPTTTRADRGAVVVRRIRKPDGSYVISASKKGRAHTADIIEATETMGYYSPSKSEEAEEKREGQKAPKGASVDMTKDSRDRMQAMSPQAFKKKFMLPPTVGNTSAGGEDSSYAQGKYSVAEEKTLNSLYADLSEENKEIFEDLIQTEQGVKDLLDFAKAQGYKE
jgi:hypothetical protein